MFYYKALEGMVGFSVVTSGLMGAVVIVFLVNCYILSTNRRVVNSGLEYVELGSSLVYLKDPISKGLFGYQLIVFLFASIVRVGDFFMQMGWIGREYEAIPEILLHGVDGVEPFFVIEAHLFGFITGLLVTSFIMGWTFIFKRHEYEERIKTVFMSD